MIIQNQAELASLNFSQVFKLVRTKYVITYTEDVMLLRALLSILYIARFLGFEGFFPNYRDFSATDPICSLLRDKALALRPALASQLFSSVGWVRILSGAAQGTESLVNQAEKRFERICRAEFDVNTSSARFEPSCNLKES